MAKTLDSPVPGVPEQKTAFCCLCGVLQEPDPKNWYMMLCTVCASNLPFKREGTPYPDTPSASLYSGVHCCVCDERDVGALVAYPVCKDSVECQKRFIAYLEGYPGPHHARRRLPTPVASGR